MKKNIDEMNLILERNNINLLESVRKKDNQYQDTQQEIGHALMSKTSNPKSLLIDSGASNHMMENKDPSHLWTPTKAFPSTWDMILRSFQKEKVL